MKKLILLSCLGLLILGVTKKEGFKSEPSFHYKNTFERAQKTQLPHKTSEAKVLHSQNSSRLSYDDLEKKYYHLETREVEKMLDDLEIKLQSSNLLTLANKRELTLDEKEEMLLNIRTKAALTRILIEKTYQEFL